MGKYLELSVHQVVDFLLRSGDIDSRIFNASSMQEGSRIHASYQSKQKANYLSEYPLSYRCAIDEVQIEVIGRADGIIDDGLNEFTVDEIKTTVVDLETFKDQNYLWHLGQAKFYAFMFSDERKLSSINIRLTYIRQGKEKEKMILEERYTYSELKQFFYSLLDEYLDFYKIIFRKNESRNLSINDLDFPFTNYRRGQRELAKYCYGVYKNRGRLFCEAPTGIGKTMSTLFPFIKAINDDDKAKIFYLTAKTSGRESAMNALKILKSRGLSINNIEITAKDKVCFCKGSSCNPDECPFARNYYGKIQQILRYSLLSYSTFDYETIVDIAKENEICPFEFELDLSLFCDVIVCDYNYLFHPISYMKRFFDEDSSHYLALVDECHNLIDRSRDMYSAHLNYNTLKEARYSIRHIKSSKLKRQLSKIKELFEVHRAKYTEEYNVINNFSDETYKTINRFVLNMQDLLKKESESITPEVMDLYLEFNQFLRISDFYSERYVAYVENKEDYLSLNLFCMDASTFLQKCTNALRGSVFFSATLSPISYYVNTLGGDTVTDSTLLLSSPFPRDNLKIMIAPKVSIKYKDRDKTMNEVRDYIRSFISQRVGNYFVYVPSYEYLTNLLNHFVLEDADIFVQAKEMSDQEREVFLLNFQNFPTKTAVGFLVIGGAFSEGIDLVSDRLIGAVIVGIGMPKINFESDCISQYFDSKSLSGKDYAYINPGMNKVMQAVGRVIRSEDDRGAVLLIDDRYLLQQYRDVFKAEWDNYEVVYTPKEVEEQLTSFFIFNEE